MRKLLKFIITLFGLCLSVGIVVDKLEKKGWVEGHEPNGIYEKHVKRPLDFGVSLMAVFFLWPIMIITGMLVRRRLGTPVLFSQKRPGLGGQVFTIRKFRTMTDQRGKNGELLSDEERLTDFGKRLRSSSLDELPELFNIVKGDMSIVGPRPLLVEYLERYNKEQQHRHDVRPGLTGLAQVNGRNELDWEERFEDDVEYVNNITFLGDLKILWKTVSMVFQRKGISSGTSATMEKFTGSKEA